MAESGNSSTMEGRKERGREKKKKKKAETAEKLQELHSDLSHLIQSEAEAITLLAKILQQKSSTMDPGKLSRVQELQAQLAVKDQEIQMLEAELQALTGELSANLERVNRLRCPAVPSAEPQAVLKEKEKQVAELLDQLVSTISSLELQRKQNKQLQEETWRATDVLSATESEIGEKLSNFQKQQAQLFAKDQEILKLHATLEKRTEELAEKMELLKQQSCSAVPSPDLQTFLLEKEKQETELQKELDQANDFLDLQRIRNNQLRETNWRSMEALSAALSRVQEKLGKVQELQAQSAVKDQEIQVLRADLEKRVQELSETTPPVPCRAGPSTELPTLSLEKQVSDLQNQLAMMNNCLERERKKNNQLSAMEALSAPESTVGGKVNKGQLVVKDQKIQVHQHELEMGEQDQH